MNDQAHFLELKIPPPVLALLVALAMWYAAKLPAPLAWPEWVSMVLATCLFVAGPACALAAFIGFGIAKTTINPHKPQNASALVRSGIYRVTRNPMYLGLLLVLSGWALNLGNPWALAGPVFFKLYIDRFQIVPEERVLTAKFGAEYADYVAKVRRWI